MIKLQWPVENFSYPKNFLQLFGVNKSYYSSFGLIGHPGVDLHVDGPNNGYGSNVRAAHDGYATHVIHHNQIGNTLLVQGFGFYSLYGHLQGFNVSVGQKVSAGDIVAFAGNTGNAVNPMPTPSHPFQGTHVHFAIILPGVKNEYPVSEPRFPQGSYVDPLPWLFSLGDKLPMSLPRDLYPGRSGNDVSMLQTLLTIEGMWSDQQPTGFYGTKTATALRALQRKYGLVPFPGVAGPKTRTLLTKRFIL